MNAQPKGNELMVRKRPEAVSTKQDKCLNLPNEIQTRTQWAQRKEQPSTGDGVQHEMDEINRW